MLKKHSTKLSLAVTIWLCMIGLVPEVARGQISKPFEDGTWPVGLSISGGISLGAYQAGVNWSLLEAFRRAATDSASFAEFGVPRYRLAVVSGASAGNINTLLWAVEACTNTDKPLTPQSSLFWQVWTGIGLNNMLPRENEGDLSLLDRQALDSVIAKVDRRLTNARLYDHCAVPAAITLTRVLPDTIRLVSDPNTTRVPTATWRTGLSKPDTLEVVTQRFATTFMFSVRGNTGEFTAPFAYDVNQHVPYGKVIQLPTVPNSSVIPNADVYAAVKASSAFPLAFQPVKLSYFFPGDRKQLHSDVFIDGGVFDNNPVGLALEFYREKEARLRQNMSELDLLYVNPGRIREPFRSALKAKDSDTVAAGGLRTLMTFAGGAVSTARQYELQLVARDTSLYTRVPFRLGFTDRGAPIFGEHLGAFAAFIALPMREYDFAIGAYDGLHFIAQQYACRVDQEKLCTARKLQNLILSNAINLGPSAASLVDLLYQKEFGRSLTDSISKLWPITGRDSLKAELFSAFNRKLVPHHPERDEYCEGLSLAALTLCKDGLRDVMNDLNTPEVIGLLEKLYGEGACSRRSGDCDPSLLIMLRDIDRNSDRMLDRFVARLGDVERRVNPGVTSTEMRLTSAAYWMFRASSGAHPPQDFDPSSIPDSRTVFHLLPFYVGQNLGTSGFELRWRPTWNPTRSVGVTLPIMTQWNWNVRRPGRRYDFYPGTGLGLVFRGIPKVSELGVATHVWRPTFDDGHDLFAEFEGSLRLLQLVQVGVRHTVGSAGKGRMHGDATIGYSLGLTDVNGLLYWIRNLR